VFFLLSGIPKFLSSFSFSPKNLRTEKKLIHLFILVFLSFIPERRQHTRWIRSEGRIESQDESKTRRKSLKPSFLYFRLFSQCVTMSSFTDSSTTVRLSSQSHPETPVAMVKISQKYNGGCPLNTSTGNSPLYK